MVAKILSRKIADPIAVIVIQFVLNVTKFSHYPCRSLVTTIRKKYQLSIWIVRPRIGAFQGHESIGDHYPQEDILVVLIITSL